MASSILSSLGSKISFSTTNETTGYPVWANLKIVDVSIEGQSENSDFPISLQQYANGTTYLGLQSADMNAIKVLMPTRIIIDGIAPDISTVQSVLSAFGNTQATFTILTKGFLSQQLSVTNVEIDQNAEVLSAALIKITLERTKPAAPSAYAPAQPSDLASIGSVLQTLGSALTSSVTGLYNTVATAL
jgi:hypothetical protein